ncbi:VOC family protein [Rhizorhabdus phycosphaerae]|uniref:VOC family protein n=1 Tax=Rhizorhabdus phycosphaerae TaxID=2711156 RepID=UPI0013EC0CBC|nr:VOC family protein [Rhizorhabdus phycosphaerae]
MSRLFGPVFQIAYVVEDVDAAVAHWTGTMGVGPFVRFPVPLAAEWLEVRGKRVPADEDIFAAVAIAYSGDSMIELIQPGSAPSPYREFLAAGRAGVHHLGTFADDYDAQLAAARKTGITVAMEGVLPISRFAYLDTDALWPGTMVEIIEAKPEMHDYFAAIRAASREWDGKTPVVEL